MPEPAHQPTVPVVSPPAEAHYREVLEESDHLILFLGASANADDHEGPWREESEPRYPPDDRELAGLLAEQVNWDHGSVDLAEVAQRVRTLKGDRDVFTPIRPMLAVDSEPGPVHMFLADLPRRLARKGGEKRYPMIVTPKYDLALERAFRARREEFDVAVFMGPETPHPGRFAHVPYDDVYVTSGGAYGWDGKSPIPIPVGNKYSNFPIVNGPDGGELKRTVIVHLNGAVDDAEGGIPWLRNYVITEDHYIDYMSDRAAQEIVPGQILAQLQDSNYLFLGYTIADWRLRVFLKRIWKGEDLGSVRHWAIAPAPDELEQRLWSRLRVDLFRSPLNDYLRGFADFLDAGPPAA
jgi:hypothetical protein